MARPSRCRRICIEPKYNIFAPSEISEPEQIILTVDEFEAIRLIDYEKKTHEQCAAQMNISRTTVTEIYERARGKIAESLVDGKQLRIEGGNYELCDGSAWRCCGKKCSKSKNTAQKAVSGKDNEIMKIAVTYENGNVFQHFGHTEQFKIYDICDGKVTSSKIIGTNGSGHGALASLLSLLGVDTLICGGIGGGAKSALAEAGIRLYGGVSGNADEAVEALLNGRLVFNPNIECSHHHHGEGHNCSAHGAHHSPRGKLE